MLEVTDRPEVVVRGSSLVGMVFAVFLSVGGGLVMSVPILDQFRKPLSTLSVALYVSILVLLGIGALLTAYLLSRSHSLFRQVLRRGELPAPKPLLAACDLTVFMMSNRRRQVTLPTPPHRPR